MTAFGSFALISLSLLQFFIGTNATTLTITNNCNDIIWPAVLPNTGSPPLSPSGFLLNPGASKTLPVRSGWSGRVWARTHCATSSFTSEFSCATGDCGCSAVDCGVGGGKLSPPATVVEFTINAPPGCDTYSVSVVDGYNLPVTVAPTMPAGAGSCSTVGCAVNFDSAISPAELRVSYGGGNESVGLKSACEAFEEAEYCCNNSNGSYLSSKITCQQNSYSELFKNWCPQARTFANDNTGTFFTCEAQDYAVNFYAPTFRYPSNPTRGTGTLPEGQDPGSIYGGKKSSFKFKVTLSVSVAVTGSITLYALWRWYFKPKGGVGTPSPSGDLPDAPAIVPPAPHPVYIVVLFVIIGKIRKW